MNKSIGLISICVKCKVNLCKLLKVEGIFKKLFLNINKAAKLIVAWKCLRETVKMMSHFLLCWSSSFELSGLLPGKNECSSFIILNSCTEHRQL